MTSQPLPHSTDRFELQQHHDGQIYIYEQGKPRLHAQINNDDVEIQVCGDQNVVIDKLYGPLIFWSIRVRADIQTCEWVVERQMGPTGDEWREYARIPGQLDSDFTDPD